MIFSIICPAFNEEKNINNILNVFTEFCPKPSELFIVDGGSRDNTRRIVEEWMKRNNGIHLVDNPDRFVSFAFNKCYPLTKGKYLALLGAHSEYTQSFFETALTELESNHADVVGGPLKHVGKGGWGKAIAWCMSTRFGVGGTEFRVSKKRGFVDSVAFAFYKREVFEKIGLFDITLKRNQDDEMHYRINAAGFRILMVPEMECKYYVRSNLKDLFKQYFEYGSYKPMVIKKVKSGFRLRHVVPALFCIYLFSVPIFILTKFYVLLIPLVFYLFLTIIFSFFSSISFKEKLKAIIVYPVIHISYGIGFLTGLFRLF